MACYLGCCLLQGLMSTLTYTDDCCSLPRLVDVRRPVSLLFVSLYALPRSPGRGSGRLGLPSRIRADVSPWPRGPSAGMQKCGIGGRGHLFFFFYRGTFVTTGLTFSLPAACLDGTLRAYGPLWSSAACARLRSRRYPARCES